MIERGLSLVPMNPFIWMLWANYLACLNCSDAQQWVLREAVRLFLNDEHSRVELARLLIQQGNYKEAEHWLREAIERNPNAEASRVELARVLIKRDNTENTEHYLEEAEDLLLNVVENNPENEQSRVVLAKLRVIQHRTPEAENLLMVFSKRYSWANQARKLLTIIQNDRFMSSSWLDLDSDNGVNHNVQNSSKQNDKSVQVNSNLSIYTDSNSDALTNLLNELQRRATLQTEFNQADNLENINQDAAQGDALACFYLQWLKPHETLNSPPHAWAAQACHLYQTHAPEIDWQQLNQTFPEHRLINRFLYLQTTENGQEATALLTKLSSDVKAQTPLQQFMYQSLKANNSPDKNCTVLAVLASAAAPAPQLISCR
jgi:tetratricopeptide (TPR) repeat protein